MKPTVNLFICTFASVEWVGVEKYRTWIPHLWENTQDTHRTCPTWIGSKKGLNPSVFKPFSQYPRPESNRHRLNGDRILSPACLPVPPPGQIFSYLTDNHLFVSLFFGTNPQHFRFTLPCILLQNDALPHLKTALDRTHVSGK